MDMVSRTGDFHKATTKTRVAGGYSSINTNLLVEICNWIVQQSSLTAVAHEAACEVVLRGRGVEGSAKMEGSMGSQYSSVYRSCLIIEENVSLISRLKHGGEPGI